MFSSILVSTCNGPVYSDDSPDKIKAECQFLEKIPVDGSGSSLLVDRKDIIFRQGEILFPEPGSKTGDTHRILAFSHDPLSYKLNNQSITINFNTTLDAIRGLSYSHATDQIAMVAEELESVVFIHPDDTESATDEEYCWETDLAVLENDPEAPAGTDQPVYSVFNYDGTRLLVISRNKPEVYLLDCTLPENCYSDKTLTLGSKAHTRKSTAVSSKNSDAFYVASYGNDRVFALTRVDNGYRAESIIDFSMPAGIAISCDDLFLIVAGNNRIVFYHNSGDHWIPTRSFTNEDSNTPDYLTGVASVVAGALQPDGSQFVFALADQYLLTYQQDAGSSQWELSDFLYLPEYGIPPDCKSLQINSGSDSGTVLAFNCPNGEIVTLLNSISPLFDTDSYHFNYDQASAGEDNYLVGHFNITDLNVPGEFGASLLQVELNTTDADINPFIYQDGQLMVAHDMTSALVKETEWRTRIDWDLTIHATNRRGQSTSAPVSITVTPDDYWWRVVKYTLSVAIPFAAGTGAWAINKKGYHHPSKTGSYDVEGKTDADTQQHEGSPNLGRPKHNVVVFMGPEGGGVAALSPDPVLQIDEQGGSQGYTSDKAAYHGALKKQREAENKKRASALHITTDVPEQVTKFEQWDKVNDHDSTHSNSKEQQTVEREERSETSPLLQKNEDPKPSEPNADNPEPQEGDSLLHKKL